MWRLVLTTGFGGTILCLAFFARRSSCAEPVDRRRWT